MENLSHSLTGWMLARAGLDRFCPRAGFLMVVAANIPDIDMVSMAAGRLRNLEIHRGYTHSVLCAPLMALIPVALTALVFRRKLPWTAAWLISLIGVLSHLLIDWTMSYGIRLALPFSSRWSYLDLFSLYDWVILTVLITATLAPRFSKLVSDEIGDRRRSTGQGWAIFALCFSVFYGGFRALMHARAVTQLESRVYNEFFDGPALRVAALPDALNPFVWNGVVEGEHAYCLYRVPALRQFDPSDGTQLYKTWDPAVKAASQTRALQYCLYFARFPFWQEQPADTPTDKLVILTDLRFGLPGNFFTIYALVNQNNQAKQVSFDPNELTASH